MYVCTEKVTTIGLTWCLEIWKGREFRIRQFFVLSRSKDKKDGRDEWKFVFKAVKYCTVSLRSAIDRNDWGDEEEGFRSRRRCFAPIQRPIRWTLLIGSRKRFHVHSANNANRSCSYYGTSSCVTGSEYFPTAGKQLYVTYPTIFIHKIKYKYIKIYKYNYNKIKYLYPKFRKARERTRKISRMDYYYNKQIINEL